MAFFGFIRDVIYRSALSVIRVAGLNAPERDLVSRVQANNRAVYPASYQSYQGVTRSALATARAAAALEASAGGPLPRAAHPIDPTIGPDDPRYRYRVAVEYVGASGESVRTVGILNSDERMSRDDIEAAVANRTDYDDSQRRSVRAAIARIQPTDIITITIISAGRR